MPIESTQPFNKKERDPRDELLVGEVLGIDVAEDMRQLVDDSEQPREQMSELKLSEGERAAVTQVETRFTSEDRRGQYHEWAGSFDCHQAWVDLHFEFLEDGSVETTSGLRLQHKKITSLPPALKRVRGDLNLSKSGIKDISSLEGVKIDGTLKLSQTDIKEVPPDIDIGKSIYIDGRKQIELSEDIRKKGYKVYVEGIKL